VVAQPGAEQVRAGSSVCDGGGNFPGRLPFMTRCGLEALLHQSYSSGAARSVSPDRPEDVENP
jgi:hypothetical protein